ncbi:MAG: UDP-glucose 6-dehydrogenase, partial [Hyphomicrobiales bacterium]
MQTGFEDWNPSLVQVLDLRHIIVDADHFGPELGEAGAGDQAHIAASDHNNTHRTLSPAAVFIAVGTPSRRGDGHADLSYVYDAAREIAQAMDGQMVVVTKSTVPVGTGREVARIIAETRPGVEFDVVSNPEFLREGSAIEDFMRPNRIVIGAESEHARDVMRALYRPL